MFQDRNPGTNLLERRCSGLPSWQSPWSSHVPQGSLYLPCRVCSHLQDLLFLCFPLSAPIIASAPSSLWISPAVLFPSAGTIASAGGTSFIEKALLCEFGSISGPSQLALPCLFALKPSATQEAASFCSIWATPYNSVRPAFKSAP